MSGLLPGGFEDLEHFVSAWALPTEAERMARRVGSTMTDIQSFHDAVLPRLEAMFARIDEHPLDQLPPEVQRLMYLALSLAEVTPAVHFFKEPVPRDVFHPSRFVRYDVPNMTPQY